MSRQDRALRGAARPDTSTLAYRLQRPLQFSLAFNCYLLPDRKLLDEAAAHILRLEEAIRKLSTTTPKESPSAEPSPR